MKDCAKLEDAIVKKHRKLVARRIGRYVYCHHCRRIDYQTLGGVDHRGWTVLQCANEFCGGLILIDWLAGQS